jgi:hypothetical protein
MAIPVPARTPFTQIHQALPDFTRARAQSDVAIKRPEVVAEQCSRIRRNRPSAGYGRRRMMKTLLAITFLSGVLVSPAFAQMSAGDMTCREFSAMDSSSQMAAAGAMRGETSSGAMSSEHTMAPDTTSHKSGRMATDHMAPSIHTITQACKGHPDMMVSDAMKQAPQG